MKDCQKIHPLLSLYMEKQLPPAEQSRMDSHLKACPEARQELEDYQRLRAASLALSEPKIPRDLHEKIMARVTGKVQPISRPNRFWAWAPVGFAAAAALLFFILNPLTQTKKTLVVAELPKAFDEKAAPSGSSPNHVVSGDIHIEENIDTNRSQSSSNEAMRDLSHQPLVMAQAKKEMKSERKAPSTAFAPMVSSNETQAGNGALALASKPAVNASAAPMEVPSALPAAGLAIASSTPHATDRPIITDGEFEGEVKLSSSNNISLETKETNSKTKPKFERFDTYEIEPNKYELTWETNKVTKGQALLLDSNGTTLRAFAEEKQFAYVHQAKIDASKIKTGYSVQITAKDLNDNKVVIDKNVSISFWTGNNAPSTIESEELVTDAVAFQQNWQQLRPGETAPEVDFSSQAVVLLMAGEEPTAGYSIHVSNLEEKTDQLVIHYNVNSPAPETTETQVLTHPWSMQVIPKPTKPVIFQRD